MSVEGKDGLGHRIDQRLHFCPFELELSAPTLQLLGERVESMCQCAQLIRPVGRDAP
jgi:hypothetical protein